MEEEMKMILGSFDFSSSGIMISVKNPVETVLTLKTCSHILRDPRGTPCFASSSPAVPFDVSEDN